MPAPLPRRFKVVERRNETADTFTLVFAPADGQPLFAFQAGQFVMLHLLNPDGSTWAKAAYSIANGPCESRETIELGIKLAGDFTRRASKLAIGDEVIVQGPYGMFVLKQDAAPLVFFAAGVGVTPMRSMIREALLNGETRPVYLFYSCKDRAGMAYEQEMRDLAKRYSNFHPILVLTRDNPAGWDGRVERLNADFIKACAPSLAEGRVWMCGPKEFMDGVKAMLISLGLDVATRLHKESFG